MDDISALYQDTLAKHRNGDISGAEEGYRAVLDAAPDHAGSGHFLGGILHQKRQIDVALHRRVRPFFRVHMFTFLFVC